MAAAGLANGFDRIETHVSWTPLRLDEQGWLEMADVRVGVLAEAARIEAESLERLASPGEAVMPIRSEVAIQHFERAPAEPRTSA